MEPGPKRPFHFIRWRGKRERRRSPGPGGIRENIFLRSSDFSRRTIRSLEFRLCWMIPSTAITARMSPFQFLNILRSARRDTSRSRWRNRISNPNPKKYWQRLGQEPEHMRLLEFVSLIRPLRGDGPLTRDVNGVA